MDIPVVSTLTLSRDLLVEELTNLRSLLRLNADGVGDDADLVHQLNQTRGAIDQFCASLSEKRDLLITPESVAPASPSSSNSTSPRLSLDSLPSWRSSRTSQLSLSIDGEIARELGSVVDIGSRQRQGPRLSGGLEEEEEEVAGEAQEEGDAQEVVDWRAWRVQMGLGLEEFGENGKVLGKRDILRALDNQEGLEGEEQDEEEAEIQDETFKRLSLLLASLQSQAEAAVSNPTTPLRDGSNSNIPEGEEAYRFPQRSPTSSPLPRFRKFPILASLEPNSAPSRPLFRNAFRRSKSLPYAAFSCAGAARTASLSSIPDVEPTPTKPGIDLCADGASDDTNVEYFTTSPPQFSPNLLDIPDNAALRPALPARRSTFASATSTNTMEAQCSWPNTPPLSGSLSPGLRPTSGLSSRRSSMSLSRRSSAIIKDMGLETLIGDILEAAAKVAEREHDQAFVGLLWGILVGGGVLWFAVGWALKWNCECGVQQCDAR